MLKDLVKNLKPSSTLLINETSKKLEEQGRKTLHAHILIWIKDFSNVSYSLPLKQKANWPVIGDMVRAGNLPAQVQSHVPFHVPGVLEGLFISACVFFYEKDSYSGLLTLKNHVGEHYYEGLSAYFHFCILKEDADSWLQKYWASSSTE